MKAKVVLKVEVEVATNWDDTYLADIENAVVMHAKNCLLDNPDCDNEKHIDDVDVTIEKSAIL